MVGESVTCFSVMVLFIMCCVYRQSFVGVMSWVVWVLGLTV